MASKKAKAAARKSKPAPVSKKPTKAAPKKGRVSKAGPPLKAARAQKPARAQKAARVEPALKALKAGRAAVPAPKGKAASAPLPPAKTEPPVRPSMPPPTMSSPGRRADGWMGPLPDKPQPRRTKLPGEGNPLHTRDMEQVRTVGMRGAVGEGSLKGRLIVYQGFPYLEVIGRDRRELWFLLQGPDQEVFPAYVNHKVSVSGLIRRFHNYGGAVDVRKYSAKLPEQEKPAVEEEEPVERLRLLSPGEVETIANPGMSVGVKGFATLRGRLEMTGDDFALVVSNPGTRQQVAFAIGGKLTKGLKKYVGEILVVTGVVEKATGWGGRIEAENCSPRAPDYPPVARDAIELTEVDGSTGTSVQEAEVRVNNGLTVALPEKPGFCWAIEPQAAKRVSLREVNVEPSGDGIVREFFFTPRNPGVHEIDFYLGKILNPMQVSKMFKVVVNVKGAETV
jgi:hypothetical protein